MRWPKYWSFSFSIIPSKEIPGLISFRMDWLDLLAVQGTLKSLLHDAALLPNHQPVRTVQLSSFPHLALKNALQDFPGGPVVKTSPFKAEAVGSILVNLFRTSTV